MGTIRTWIIKPVYAFGFTAAIGNLLFGVSVVQAHTFLIDLTYPTPTFEPTEGDMNKSDMSKPVGDSDPRGIPSFGPQAVYLVSSRFPTGQGYFYTGRLSTSEHHGTHMDAPAHYVNDTDTIEGNNPVQTTVDKLGAGDLIGRVVLSDISGRVQAELDKNGGKPSPDKSVTDFSNCSPNVVTADDIAAVAGFWFIQRVLCAEC